MRSLTPSLQLRVEAERERRRRRRERDATPPALIEWANRHRRIDDRHFSLERFAPLEEIYEHLGNDDHKDVVIMKPAQKGVSELLITFACWVLDVGASFWKTGKSGLNVGYLFPTQTALSDFSKERFSGLRVETDHLARLFTAYDDVGFKQAGQSYLYLRGAWSSKALQGTNKRQGGALKSFPADVLILDEFEEMDSAAVALALKRLLASPVKRAVKLSTPRLPGRGIHASYLNSDQRVWEVQCQRSEVRGRRSAGCGAWVELDFFRDVRADGESWEAWKYWSAEQLRNAALMLACPSCRASIDRLGPGRWVARHPELTGVRGYHIPALSFPMVSLLELVLGAIKTEPSEIEEFFRSDLGLPYEVSGSRVTETMLAALSHQLENGRLPEDVEWRDTTMGVDVGARHHYRISSTGPGGLRYIRRMGSVREWGALDLLLEQYQIRRCVIDALPELHACEAWASKHKGIVIRAFYPNSEMKGQLFQPDPDKIDDVVDINRTMAMDAVYANVAGGKEVWPRSIHADPEVIAHMKAPVRVVSVDARGQDRASWEHTAPDHFYHASVYDLVAARSLPEYFTPKVW